MRPVLQPQELKIREDSQEGDPPTRLAASQKWFRVRYDRIAAFDPYEDGFGIMRDAQTDKPQAFRIGDCWSACNMAAIRALPCSSPLAKQTPHSYSTFNK